MTLKPKISVILPVCNCEKYIAMSVSSVLAQSFTDFELIVVDDGSRDKTSVILREVNDRRLKLIIKPENQGLVAALNSGIEIAKGELIARQDADDISLSERFAKQLTYLAENSQVGFVGTAYAKIDSEGKVLLGRRMPEEHAEIINVLQRTNCFCHGSVMFRRSCLEHCGSYRETAGPTEDYDLWLRFSEISQAANLPEVLYHWRVSPAGIMSNSSEQQAEKSRALLRKIAELRRKSGNDPLVAGDPEIRAEFMRVKQLLQSGAKPKKRDSLAQHCFKMAEDFLRLDMELAALKWLLKAIMYRPFRLVHWKLLAGLCRRFLRGKKCG